MITAGSIATQIGHDINETNVKHMGMIIAAISRAYKLVLGEHSFSCASQKFEPSSTLTASANAPLVLPSDLDRISSVADYRTSAVDHDIYYEDFSKGRNPKQYKNWWYDTPVQTALDTGRSASVDQDGVTVTLDDDTFHADVAGEYICIGKDTSIYYISTRDSATEVTISTPFKGKDAQNAPYVVRPPIITKRIRFSNNASEALSPVDLTIWYQRDMPDITEDSDIIPIPNDGAAVYYKALQLSYRRKGWSSAAKKLEPDYIHALALAKREDPHSRDTLKPKAMFRRPRQQSLTSQVIRR